MPDIASLHTVRRAATEQLGTHTLTMTELIDRLRAVGLELGDDAIDTIMRAIDDDGRFVELDDERWLSVPKMLDGTTWTTTVPEPLPAEGCLAVYPDLTLFAWWAIETPLPVTGVPGGALEVVELDDGTDALLGPPGWLAAEHTHRIVMLAVHDGDVALSHPASAPEPSPDQVRALRAAFDAAATHDELSNRFDEEARIEVVTMPLETLLWEALVASHDAFDTPVAPVDALLAAAGLERDGVVVGIIGTDWTAHGRLLARRRIGYYHDLVDEQVDMVEVLLGASDAVIDNAPQPLGPDGEEPTSALFLALCLADASVAQAFVGEHADRGTPPEDLGLFAYRLLPHLDGDVAAGPRWLLARALDHLGDSAGARSELEAAAASPLDHPLALRALAGFRADAGDAPAALLLLRRAGLDTAADGDDHEDEDSYDPLFVEVVPFAARPRPTARRNDRCPCGSGRKYKDCHLGKEQQPLLERGAWLYRKARRYLHDGRQRPLVGDVASTITDASGRGSSLLLELLDSALVDDVALHEGSVFDEFLAARDAILPDDEALLASRWALVDRSLFDVEAIEDDDLKLRDLRTGDTIVVTNTDHPDTVRPGVLLLGRPLPVEDTWRAYSGFVPVADRLRDDVLVALDDGDLFEVAAAIGAACAPPTLQNTDGEPLVFHELTFRVPDAEDAARALAASKLHDNGDGHFTLVRDSANQADTVVLSLELDGHELCVTTNSERRANDARELVAELLPDALFVDEDVRDLEEVLAAPPEPHATPSSDDDPALAAALDEFLRERERRWLDEPVPALRGLTPRQAAGDPVAREDLEHLLRTLDGRRGTGGFDAGRLRALLGLDAP